MTLIILGIDPGLSITGYGCIELKGKDVKLLEGGIIKTDPKQRLEERLVSIFDDLNFIIKSSQPASIVIEELYSHYGHPVTAIKMGHARGVIFLAAAKNSIPVCSYSATRIKKSLTGNGRATKETVQRAIGSTLRIETLSFPPDVSDALAIALCHANVVSRKSIS